MLIGMDLLRRVNFSLAAEADSSHGTLTLGSQQFSMVYTDTGSLHISVLNIHRTPEFNQAAAVHLLRKTEIPPRSGCFLEARIARAGPANGDILVTPILTDKLSIPHLITSACNRKCSIWVVNSATNSVTLGHGTRLGIVSEIDKLYSRPYDRQEEAAAGEDIVPIRPGPLRDHREQGKVDVAVGTNRPPTSFMPTGCQNKVEVRAPSVAAAKGEQDPLRTEPWADKDASCKAFHGRQGSMDVADGMCRPPTSSKAIDDYGNVEAASFDAAKNEQNPVRPEHWADGAVISEDEESDGEDNFLWDDYGMGLSDCDMLYDDVDIEGAVLPPSVALAACDAAEALSSKETAQPDLMHLEEENKSKVLEVIGHYSELFDGGEDAVGLIPGIKHTIDTGEAKPVCTRQWRLPYSARETIREQCNKMLRTGVIEPSTSPWLSPVVLVKKKDGSIRFCVDYRGLNAVTQGDSYPLPRIEELLDELGPMNIFTTLDARAAYWAVEVDPSDRPKTAFSDGYRLFQFVRLPFGLSTAPTTFQRTINVVLAAVLGKHTLCYLDDIIIYSRTFAQHLIDLDETLGLLKAAGLKLNMEKCTFAATTINFLGFIISPEGVSPDKGKVLAISKTPTPRTVREVRRFLGATGFFRKHIPGYATIASSLHLLLRKDQKWHWGPEQQAAFNELKERLVTAPVLRQPDFSKEFELHTDASGIAIGACLMQQDDNQAPHAIAYYSRKLRSSETRYPTIDLEALAVVEGVRVFDPYLYGRRFVVYTDHRPLVHVFTRKTKSPRMTRYAHDLSFYNFSIRYKEGPMNHVPDMLSRQVARLVIADGSPENIAKEQEKDPQLSDLRYYLKDGKVPKKKLPLSLAEFELKDGVIYRLRHLPDRICYQLVVPSSLKNSALKASHLPPLASHPGVQRTFENARSLYYWSNMLKDVKTYVENCPVCQQSRGSPQKVVMAEAPLAEFPLERISMDLMDFGQSVPMRYCLSILDQHSRFLQLVPLRRATASSVHHAFFDHWVSLFGPPRVIQTDNGVQFTSHLFQELTKMLYASNHYTVRYHPQANGLVERTNRVVKSALTSLVTRNPRTWHQFVSEVRLQINSAIHRTTGEQPLYLLTGRHANFQVGLTNQAVFMENINLQERLREARNAAIAASKEARATYGRYYHRGKNANFKPDLGTLVWYYEQRQGGSLPPLSGKWRGPARVVSILGPVTIQIRDIHTEVEFRAHLNHVKPFRSSAEFSYALEDEESEEELDEPTLPDDHLGPVGSGDPRGNRAPDPLGDPVSHTSNEAPRQMDGEAVDGPISSRLRSRYHVPDEVDPDVAVLLCGVRAPDFHNSEPRSPDE